MAPSGPQTPQSFETSWELRVWRTWGGGCWGYSQLREGGIFTSFCTPLSMYPDLSECHRACRLAPPDPLLPLSLSACSDGGPDNNNNNSTQPCIVFRWKLPQQHKRLTHSVVFFFWAHFTPIFWSAFYRPLSHTLSKRFCGSETTSWDKRG